MNAKNFILITVAVFIGTLATAGIIAWLANNKINELKSSNGWLSNLLG